MILLSYIYEWIDQNKVQYNLPRGRQSPKGLKCLKLWFCGFYFTFFYFALWRPILTYFNFDLWCHRWSRGQQSIFVLTILAGLSKVVRFFKMRPVVSETEGTLNTPFPSYTCYGKSQVKCDYKLIFYFYASTRKVSKNNILLC